MAVNAAFVSPFDRLIVMARLVPNRCPRSKRTTVRSRSESGNGIGGHAASLGPVYRPRISVPRNAHWPPRAPFWIPAADGRHRIVGADKCGRSTAQEWIFRSNPSDHRAFMSVVISSWERAFSTAINGKTVASHRRVSLTRIRPQSGFPKRRTIQEVVAQGDHNGEANHADLVDRHPRAGQYNRPLPGRST